MAFNAQWEFDQLARQVGKTVPNLVAECKLDFAEMVSNCPVYLLSVSGSGNYFVLLDKDNSECHPPRVAGLYSIFTQDSVVYFGEGTDLYRRQLNDPDNTADSGKRFSNQRRAIIKLILHKGWASSLDLGPIYMQLYPGDYRLSRQSYRTFIDCYKVDQYSKALEGAIGLFAQQYHQLMIARAIADGVLV